MLNLSKYICLLLYTLTLSRKIYPLPIKTEEGKKKYQMGNQKIPNGQSEDTKWVIRRYQMGNQKIPRL
jgi:hypothetical protein